MLNGLSVFVRVKDGQQGATKNHKKTYVAVAVKQSIGVALPKSWEQSFVPLLFLRMSYSCSSSIVLGLSRVRSSQGNPSRFVICDFFFFFFFHPPAGGEK